MTEALRNISAILTAKPEIIAAFHSLFSSIGKLDVSRKSSSAFNEALTEAGSIIHWYPNDVYEDALEAVKSDNYCANLVGKKRDTQSNPFLFHSDDILVGLFLLGPNRLYPEHCHPASEMWVVLSGTAQWKRGSELWQTRNPGEYFIHTENQAHAMKTLDEPLLALWAWTGELEQWAEWVHDEKEA
ncbi:MAG: cupin domain-containing protein [Clostridium sp.]|nr:cupin domain-containing protein [Clostridium sp.]